MCARSSSSSDSLTCQPTDRRRSANTNAERTGAEYFANLRWTARRTKHTVDFREGFRLLGLQLHAPEAYVTRSSEYGSGVRNSIECDGCWRRAGLGCFLSMSGRMPVGDGAHGMCVNFGIGLGARRPNLPSTESFGGLGDAWSNCAKCRIRSFGGSVCSVGLPASVAGSSSTVALSPWNSMVLTPALFPKRRDSDRHQPSQANREEVKSAAEVY